MTRRSCLITILTVLLFAVAANVAVATFVTHERTVYYWDWRAYWHRVQIATASSQRLLGVQDNATIVNSPEPTQQNAVQESKADPFGIRVLKILAKSVWYNEYNIIPVLFLLPWTIIFGSERLPYVLGILNVYGMSAVVLLCAFCYRFPVRLGSLNNHWRLWVPLAVVAGFPLFWAPIVRGMLDVVVLACNILVLIIYFSRPLKELRWPVLIAMGLLLALSVVFRRWNAYWVVSFLLMVGLDGLIGFVRSQDHSPAHLFAQLRPGLLAGGSALAAMLVAAGPLVIRMATTDYADIYDAFNREDGVFPVLAALGRDMGYFWPGFFLLSATVLIWSRETRRLALFLTGQCVVIVVLFARTQSFAIHHYYLLQSGMLIICSVFVLRLLAQWPGTWRRSLVVGVMLVTVALIDLAMFFPRAAAWHAHLEPLVPQDTYYPLVRHDVAELNRLYATVDQLIQAAGSESKFYVLSATYELNDTHFIATSMEPPFEFSSADRLLRSHLVDKRDGFPRRLLDADIVILGSPIGGWADSSRVLLEPARLITEGVGLGRAFRELPYEFHLENDITARVFKRVRPFTTAEIQALSEHLRGLYPDYPQVYDPNHGGR